MIKKLILTLSFFTVLVMSPVFANKATYLAKGCLACHGANAEGNKALNSPSIAGLQEKYILRQLTNFKDKKRGYHAKDVHGKTMQGMSSTLTPDDIKKLASYLSGLKTVKHKATMGGDAAKGKAKFATCIACHGAKAEGNAALNAPNLSGLQDWYIVRQLSNFKNKVRGGNAAKEPLGMQMYGFVAGLDDKAMKDIAAYLVTLGN